MDKLRHQEIFKNQVEVLLTKSGAAKKYKCRRCSCVKPTRITAIQHVEKCGKKFMGKLRGKNGKTRFTCNQCPFKAGTQALLALHRRRAHLGALTRPAHKCTICKQSFKKAKYLKVHLKLHRVTPAFTCPTCKVGFTAKFSLSRHIANTHAEDDVVMHGDQVEVRSGAAELGPVLDGGSRDGGEALEQSRWSKFVESTSQESSSTDEEEGEEEGQGLTEAELARNERLLDLANCLTEYGQRHGESEEQIATMQRKIRERMLRQPFWMLQGNKALSATSPQPQPQPQPPRRHIPSSLNQVGGTVGIQLTPGVQYVITVPQQAPTVTHPSLHPSQQSQPSLSAKKFVCGTCAFEARDNFNLRRHIELQHTLVEGGLKCERYRAHSYLVISCFIKFCIENDKPRL